MAGRVLTALAVIALIACSGPSARTTSESRATPALPTPDTSGTVAAQVQATVQAMVATKTNASATVPPETTVQKEMPVVLEERFAAPPFGWPDNTEIGAWHEAGLYHLSPRRAGQFLAVGAPLTGVLSDAVISATFRKLGGPPGGGYGFILRDQNPDIRDGVRQDGRFLVAEVGDVGTVGIWRREDDHWIDLVPWTISGAVHAGEAANEVTVQTAGADLILRVNGAQAARVPVGLTNGGVGVFVGGDGNHVVLERLTVRTDSAGVRGRPRPPTATAILPAPSATVAPTTAPPKPTTAPAKPTTVPAPAAKPADLNRGITFGEPVTFSVGGASIVGVLVGNDTDQVKSFTVKATYKLGDRIAATALGAVNDLRPGQQRAASLVSTGPIPEKADSVRLDVDTMVLDAKSTPAADAAAKVSFGEPKVTGTAGFNIVEVEATNGASTALSFTVQAAFLKAGRLIGIASGAVNDLRPGQTKTASLVAQGAVDGHDEILMGVDTVVK
jgi:hypothetical protein